MIQLVEIYKNNSFTSKDKNYVLREIYTGTSWCFSVTFRPLTWSECSWVIKMPSNLSKSKFKLWSLLVSWRWVIPTSIISLADLVFMYVQFPFDPLANTVNFMATLLLVFETCIIYPYNIDNAIISQTSFTKYSLFLPPINDIIYIA